MALRGERPARFTTASIRPRCLEGRRRQLLEARRICDVRAQVNRRTVAPAGQRSGVVLSPRREHQPEALGREEPGQRLTKSSGHPDENGGGRILALLCTNGPGSGSATGNHRGLYIQFASFRVPFVSIGYYKSIYFEQKNLELTGPDPDFGHHIRQRRLSQMPTDGLLSANQHVAHDFLDVRAHDTLLRFRDRHGWQKHLEGLPQSRCLRAKYSLDFVPGHNHPTYQQSS